MTEASPANLRRIAHLTDERYRRGPSCLKKGVAGGAQNLVW